MSAQRSAFAWGVAAAAHAGEEDSGDRHWVMMLGGALLLGVIDGLGHGHKASSAAQRALDALNQQPELDLAALTARCHQALMGTRGAVLSLAALDPTARSVTWLSVGNVAGLLLRANGATPKRAHLLLRGGVVGYRLPTLRAYTETLMAGDTLVLASDGLRSNFVERIPLDLEPQAIADHLLHHYARGTDDATVLVARYLDQ